MRFKNERAFTSWALKEARKRDWSAWHFGNSLKVVPRAGGHRSIPDPDAAGFPDLTLAHVEHGLLFAELKMPGNRPTESQRTALIVLRACRVDVYVWWPDDCDEIIDVLEGRPPSRRLFDNTMAAIA